MSTLFLALVLIALQICFNPVEGLQLQPGVIAAADSHTCAIDSNGGVHCWGAEGLEPILEPPAGTKFMRIATSPFWKYYYKKVQYGSSHTCGVLSDGEMKCW